MRRPFHRTRVAAAPARLLPWALALGCRGVADPAGPTLPAGATRYAPPAVYARWWAQVEACSGLTGPPAAYAWYEVPGGTVPHPTVANAVAFTDPDARRVVIAAARRDDGRTVRHEMLHALLGAGYAAPARWHPSAYFQGRCEGWLDCPRVGCEDAGAPPPTAPADAPVVTRSALAVGVEVTPAAPSRSAADPWFQVVVRVTNPGPGPVWLDVGQNYGTAADPEYAGTGHRVPGHPRRGGRLARGVVRHHAARAHPVRGRADPGGGLRRQRGRVPGRPLRRDRLLRPRRHARRGGAVRGGAVTPRDAGARPEAVADPTGHAGVDARLAAPR